MVRISETLTDIEIEKLSKYNITNDELSILISLLELIDEDNKSEVFDLFDALLVGKTIVDSEVKNNESYTQKLLGKI